MVSDVRCIGVSDRRRNFDSRRESAHSDTITSHSFVFQSAPTTDDLARPKTIVFGNNERVGLERMPVTIPGTAVWQPFPVGPGLGVSATHRIDDQFGETVGYGELRPVA